MARVHTRNLSPREEEIVKLCVEGLTDHGIANKLAISIGTVNTHWVRIKLKAGGASRADTIARIIREQTKRALDASEVEREELAKFIADHKHDIVDLRAARALLEMAMDQFSATVWATDHELRLHIIVNGKILAAHSGIEWEVGSTVYEIFKTRDKKDPAVAAHLAGIEGVSSNVRLIGEFADTRLAVSPLTDESGAAIGCISILSAAGLEILDDGPILPPVSPL